MKAFLSFRILLTCSLLVGLALGYLFQQSPTESFESQIWLVKVKILKNQAPLIESARQADGLPGLSSSGDSQIQLLDASENILYEQQFSSNIVSGDLVINQKSLIFALPAIPEAKTCLIRTPQGEHRYELTK